MSIDRCTWRQHRAKEDQKFLSSRLDGTQYADIFKSRLVHIALGIYHNNWYKVLKGCHSFPRPTIPKGNQVHREMPKKIDSGIVRWNIAMVLRNIPRIMVNMCFLEIPRIRQPCSPVLSFSSFQAPFYLSTIYHSLSPLMPTLLPTTPRLICSPGSSMAGGEGLIVSLP